MSSKPHLTLRARLALWAALATGLAVALVAAGLFFAVNSFLFAAQRDRLTGAVGAVQARVESALGRGRTSSGRCSATRWARRTWRASSTPTPRPGASTCGSSPWVGERCGRSAPGASRRVFHAGCAPAPTGREIVWSPCGSSRGPGRPHRGERRAGAGGGQNGLRAGAVGARAARAGAVPARGLDGRRAAPRPGAGAGGRGARDRGGRRLAATRARGGAGRRTRGWRSPSRERSPASPRPENASRTSCGPPPTTCAVPSPP